MRWLLLCLLLFQPAQAQEWTPRHGPGTHNWIARYQEGVWKVNGWVEGDSVRVLITPMKAAKAPIGVSLNVFPPGYREGSTYRAMALHPEGHERYRGSCTFLPGTSHLELTIGFKFLGSVRANLDPGSVLLKGWTVSR